MIEFAKRDHELHTVTGAYGLRLDSRFTGDATLLSAAGPDWLPWSVTARVGSAAELAANRFADRIGDDAARLTLQPNGYALLDRSAASTELVLDRDPGPQGLVHPGLAMTGATVAWWHGRVALHGCAVSNGEVAVAFIGNREDGKSSTLARLLSLGWTSVSDDLLVIDGTDVLAGPRCVDLRRETAEAWNLGSYLGVVGTRERWRFAAGPVAPRTPLAGIVSLSWADSVSLTRVPAAQRPELLLARRTLDLDLRSPRALLTLLGVPTFVLGRPKDVSRIDDGIGRVVAELGLREPRRLQQ